MELKGSNGEVISIESKKSDCISSIISTMKAQKLVQKGCDAFLAYILDSKVSKKKVSQVPIVCEFSNVFLEELSGLPPEQEIEFVIELVPLL